MTKQAIILVIAMLYAVATNSFALINPNFTPIEVLDQSVLVAEIKIDAKKDGNITATITNVLQGATKSYKLSINVDTSTDNEYSQKLINLIDDHSEGSILWFVGEFDTEGDEQAYDEDAEENLENQKAFMHISAKWFIFDRGENGAWVFSEMSTKLQETWAGDTDMLLKCIKYIQNNPDDAGVPSKTYADWSDDMIKAVTMPGKIYFTHPIDLDKTTKQILHVGAEKGDALLVYDKKTKKFNNTATSRNLKTSSRIALWVDLNADEKFDLLSWDGKLLVLCLQQANGSFSAKTTVKGIDLSAGCTSMAVVDTGRKGQPSILIGTIGSPLLVVIKSDGTATSTPIIKGALPANKFKKAGPCVVADLDGDTLPDVLQIFQMGSFFYKGKALGQYDQPKPCDVMLGMGASGVCLGDYDADGMLDIFVAADDFSRLFHNFGNAKFVDMFDCSGEIAYIAKAGGIMGMTGDINNDGRQDILIIYADTIPQIFFNRGFRTFGHSHSLDLSTNELLDNNNEGGQAGCFGDFNGDGAQDLIFVSKNGDICAFFRDISTSAYAIRTVLEPGSSYIGPLTVTCWIEDLCLGAWNVAAGSGEAFLGQLEQGEYTIKWQLPGGKKNSRNVEIEEKPVRFVIK